MKISDALEAHFASGVPVSKTSILEFVRSLEGRAKAKRASSGERGSRIPADWQPDMGEAIRLGLSQGDALIEADKFRDHWTAKTGAAATKSDWLATWRNWCRSASERRANRQQNAPQQKRNFVTAARERLSGASNGSESLFVIDGDAQRVPADFGGRRSDDEDVRGGFVRHIGTSHH